MECNGKADEVFGSRKISASGKILTDITKLRTDSRIVRPPAVACGAVRDYRERIILGY